MNLLLVRAGCDHSRYNIIIIIVCTFAHLSQGPQGDRVTELGKRIIVDKEEVGSGWQRLAGISRDRHRLADNGTQSLAV